MDKKELVLPVQEMTPELMQMMEDEGLIVRLSPRHHEISDAPFGETSWMTLYDGVDGYGPHKIIAITVNRLGFPGFGTHPDQEEFLLIGTNASVPMYILVARMQREEFEKKRDAGALTADDFYFLKAKFNDPEVSFFVMNKGVPHGEGILETGDLLPSFYVTESRDLPLDLCEIGYEIEAAR
ncbi:MAG: hypothetical protein IKE58_06120 [Blautia sp.]|nr:hypothetical protein [Blautia sp.]